MATLDQLPAEQRAIVELVVQRGRSYEALADVLQVPSERVRELARDALTELSPRTASRVDPEYRGMVADYLLGQLSAGDARLTRDYLKGSESARAWALSLLDSLDPLYENGSQPAVPEPDGEPVASDPEAKAKPLREAIAIAPEPEAEAASTAEAKAQKPARETAEDRIRSRERARKPEPAARDEEERDEPEPVRRAGALSPAAEAALRRRRIRGVAGALVGLAVLVIAILAISGAFSSGDTKTSSTTGSTTTTPTGTSTTAAQPPLQVLGQIALNPIGKVKAQGVAYIVQQGTQRYVVVQAQVPPLPSNQKVAAYEVWLYNSNGDARSLGAQYTNAQGVLQGRAPLPADVAKFKAIDISRELFSGNKTTHGNASVLRGAFATLKQVPQQQQGGAGTTPAPTTPAPGTPPPTTP
ncbi:MAG: hypothetical protein QOF55_818 [Thermoleophilaceae bacterium]|nr:hypothetical protein [Thermoleophilaceae bacterium]